MNKNLSFNTFQINWHAFIVLFKLLIVYNYNYNIFNSYYTCYLKIKINYMFNHIFFSYINNSVFF